MVQCLILHYRRLFLCVSIPWERLILEHTQRNILWENLPTNSERREILPQGYLVDKDKDHKEGERPEYSGDRATPIRDIEAYFEHIK